MAGIPGVRPEQSRDVPALRPDLQVHPGTSWWDAWVCEHPEGGSKDAHLAHRDRRLRPVHPDEVAQRWAVHAGFRLPEPREPYRSGVAPFAALRRGAPEARELLELLEQLPEPPPVFRERWVRSQPHSLPAQGTR